MLKNAIACSQNVTELHRIFPGLTELQKFVMDIVEIIHFPPTAPVVTARNVESGPTIGSLVGYESSVISRVVRSTLAAEAAASPSNAR